jgi:uncharacterized protein YfaS (alpha-2-macroglobulin family)
MFLRPIFCLLLSTVLVIFSFIAAPLANPLEGQIKDPIFLRAPLMKNGPEGKNSLQFHFQFDTARCTQEYGQNNSYKGCNRHIGLEGKKAEAGITMTPEIPGEWRWSSDYNLSFTPSQFWRAGENYVVTYDLAAMGFPDNVSVNDSRVASTTFTTQTLKITYPYMNYMQDPDDSARKLVSGQLSTNYPVDAEVLKKQIRLSLENEDKGELKKSGSTPDFEFTPAADGMSAQIAVPLKTLPEQEHYLRLTVDAGLAPLHGGKATAKAFSERTSIPTLTSYLALSNTAASIIRAEDGTPQQILSLETNVKAKPEDVFKSSKLYLLPAQHPVMARSDQKDDTLYEWKADNEVSDEILAQAEQIALTPMADGKTETTQFGFTFTAPADRYLFLAVDDDMAGFGGYTLGRTHRTILQAPAWPNDIKIMQDGSILTLSGARKLSLHARGTDKLAVEIAHIRTEALQHFISQTSGDITSPSFQNWNFSKEDIAQIDTKDVPMNYKSPQESQYTAFDFSSYLQDGKKGLFLLDIQGYRNDKVTGERQQRFVLVTDMGLLVKQAENQTRDVYLVSFTSGLPVSGADISVLGRNGLPVFDGKTDIDGHAALSDFSGLIREREPVAIVAQKDGDYTFIPYNRYDRVLNLSRFDVGGNEIAAKGMNAYLFSDRGIYRPGDTAHIGAMVRNADWTALPPDLPLQMVVSDPRGRTIQDNLLKFSPPGLQEISVETGDAWPTGIYRASLYISEDGRPGSYLGGTSFRVEEFQPDRLKIKTLFTPTPPKGWAKPDALEANVTLTNLYGTAASDRRLSASVSLNPAVLSFNTYSDYVFYDPYAAKPRTITYDLPDAKTDAGGQATIPLNLTQQERATYSLNLQTRGYEAGSGRGVTAYSTLLVSPMDYAVGMTTDANLDYLRKDQNYDASLVAVDPDLQGISVTGLILDLVRKTYVSTLVRRGDGSYAYESVPREDSIGKDDFAIGAEGTILPLPTAEIGTFIYRISTKDNLVVSEIAFSVAGEGQRDQGADREAVLKVGINKDEYGPGESIELNITAPYTGAGLITLESDHVIAHQWFKTDKTDTIQTIAIPADFSGKGYVSVSFVRDINSREIYLSPLSHAVVPFIANTKARTVDIELDVPGKVTPGEPVTISYRGNATGKAMIYAVDEGILQIANYRTPDPVDFFLLNRALQVSTSQMLDLLMPEFDLIRELSAKGGDAEAEQATLGKHLNPFKRKTLAPAVYWSGIVDLTTENKTITFTPPGHFNGRLRVMAVAVTAEGVGSAEKEMIVQADLVVTPNLPVFMAPGDEAEISATIANNVIGSGADAKITLSATPTEGLIISGLLPDNIVIAEGTEKTVSFRVKATEALGPNSLIVHAALGTAKQSAEATLSIRPPVTKETTLLVGYAEKGKAKIEPTRRLHPAQAEKDIVLSALPTSYIFGLLRYLNDFPYGCTEQLVSQAYPQVSLFGMPEFAVDENIMKGKIADAITTLRQRQTPEGGFSLWGGDQNNDFITVYAMDFLTRVQDAQLPVPSTMTEDGLRYLRNWVNRDITSLDDARIKAYGIYILTRNGIVTTNEILYLLRYFEQEKITHWKTDLIAIYLASSYRLMQQNDLAEKTLGAFEKDAFAGEMTYKNWDSPEYNPFIKYARYISLTAQHFPEHKINPEIVFALTSFIEEQHYNTLSSSFAIQALRDYATNAGDQLVAAKRVLEVDGKKLSLSGETMLRADIPFDAKKLEISGDKTPLFYTLTESGYDRTMSTAPVAEKIEVERTYQTLDGKLLTESVAIGDVIEAVIKIRSHDGQSIENVAIVDLLPGGFELETEGVGTGSSFTPVFVDKREDRIIIFGTVDDTEKTFLYRMRAVAKGQFVAPAPFAEAMYDLTVRAKGQAGEIAVTDPQ